MTKQSTSDDEPVLHLIFSSTGFRAAQSRAAHHDIWVLIGDGVYALTNGQGIPSNLHVIQADLEQRGVRIPDAGQSITAIDDLELVDLVSGSSHTVSWR